MFGIIEAYAHPNTTRSIKFTGWVLGSFFLGLLTTLVGSAAYMVLFDFESAALFLMDMKFYYTLLVVTAGIMPVTWIFYKIHDTNMRVRLLVPDEDIRRSRSKLKFSLEWSIKTTEGVAETTGS